MFMSKNAQKIGRETPVGSAAKLILGERMRIARKYLRRVCGGKRTREDVHQLRVATRRLGVALLMFKSVLRRRPRRELEKAAGKLRRACGDVRDCDVLSEVLNEHLKNGAGDFVATNSVSKSLRRRRLKAERKFEDEIVGYRSRFEEATRSLTGDLRRKKFSDEEAVRRPFHLLADRSVRRGLYEFRTTANAGLEHLDQMHALRIAAKHLRYAMEAAETCYPPEFGGELYRAVESVQSRLGHINDLRNLISIAARVAAMERKRKKKRVAQARSLRELLETWTAALGDAQRAFLDVFLGGERDTLDASFRSILDGVPPCQDGAAMVEKVDLLSRSIDLPVEMQTHGAAEIGAPQVNNL